MDRSNIIRDRSVSEADLIQFKKSLWRERNSHVWSFFCPLCKCSRRVPFRQRPGGRHYVQIGLTAAFFTLLTWEWFTWKGMVSFLPMWITFETVYRARMRTALVCAQCGFDPYLYLTDVKRARQEVENFWRHKFAEKGIPYPEKGVNSAAAYRNRTGSGAANLQSQSDAPRDARSEAHGQEQTNELVP